jgi:hypothetical protein
MPNVTAPNARLSWRNASPLVALTTVFGFMIVILSFAAATPIAIEPETGTLASGATIATVTGQSGIGAVKFAMQSPAPTPTPGPGSIIWQDKFDTAATGQLTQATGDPLFAPVVAPTEDTDYVNVSIIGEGPGGSGKSLRHKIPAYELGAFIQSPRLPHDTDHATIEYDVRFDNNFDWRWGGKVGAGFVGVAPGVGIYKPTSGNTDRNIGFSARLMWHGRGDDGTRPFESKLGPIPADTDNDVVTYIYARYPVDGFSGFGWHTSLGHFERNTWHHVKIEVKMNTIGVQNGEFRAWIDGTLRYGATDWDWRNDPNISIQAILWDIHRGGGLTPTSWISSRDTFIDMANVTVRDLQ